MRNREIFVRDPAVSKLLNDGVVAVAEPTTAKEIETLRYELEHFVCEGQYKEGLVRILESFLGNADSTVQPAAWVSGFFGSGKSHLLKMLRHLWVNTRFESDGATARSLAHLPTEVHDLLIELDTLGKRCRGLHAASGFIGTAGDKSVKLAVLGIIFRSMGLPELLPQAQFCLWLQKNGIYAQVRKAVEESGRGFMEELHDLYVSPVLALALLQVDPSFAPDLKQARAALRSQFPDVQDIPVSEFVHLIRETLSVKGQLPCTAIILDEIQMFIGESNDRSREVQEVAEALCKQLDSRILLIGAGQTALASGMPQLQRLSQRFTIPVELSDTDVETVTRRVVLAKKADKRKFVEEIISANAGEIDRQLAGTGIAVRSEDRNIIVDDYPLLPVRRRFWEHVIRAIDPTGTNSRLRTQLKIVHEAVRQTAEQPLGTVVPGDFIFDQLQTDLLRSGVISREVNERINELDDGTPEGKLTKRVYALIFLIRKLPRETVVDIGVRATPAMLADLLISDLAADGPILRKEVPGILEKLVDKGKLIKLDAEYSLQTREGIEWDREFKNRQARLNSDPALVAGKRSELLNTSSSDLLGKINLKQGKPKEDRKLKVHYGNDAPEIKGNAIPVWIRDGWGESESAVLADARAAGTDSPMIFIYIPRNSADDLKKAIVDYEAAKATLDFKGSPTTDSGREAYEAMMTRKNTTETTLKSIINEVVNGARVFQGGGQERLEFTLKDKVFSAAQASLARMFPEFAKADDDRWPTVIKKAREGDEAALQAIGWEEAPEKHPVCAAILSRIGAGKTGKEIRAIFENDCYGWPRDAVDAALLVLFNSGHIRAIYKGAQLDRGQLDQAKIPATDFRLETINVSTRERIELRKLFQTAGLSCEPGKESQAAGSYLDQLVELAAKAGGEPPLPNRPSIDHLEELRAKAGNEQLIAILGQADTLKRQWAEWSKLAQLAAERKPQWDTLLVLLRHAEQLSGFAELQKQVSAVREERRLLDETNPIPEIKQSLTNLLRSALKQAHSNYDFVYSQEMAILRENENWQKLSPEQQQKILIEEGIAAALPLIVGDDEALIRSLAETSLAAWKIKTDALPQKFNRAAMAAARILEPKVQNIKLTSRTLRDEADVKAWLESVEKDLLDKIKNGPIVVA